MANLNAALTGTLTVRPPADTSVFGETKSSGCAMGLSLRGQNQAPAGEISQQKAITVAGGFTALPFPANLRGRVLYLRMSSSDPIQLQMTREVTGVEVVANILGMFLIEFLASDRLTALGVDGNAEFEWVVTGDLT